MSSGLTTTTYMRESSYSSSFVITLPQLDNNKGFEQLNQEKTALATLPHELVNALIFYPPYNLHPKVYYHSALTCKDATYSQRFSMFTAGVTLDLLSRMYPLPQVPVTVAPAPAEPTPGTSGEGSSDSTRPGLLQRIGDAFKGCFCCGSSDKPPYETVVYGVPTLSPEMLSALTPYYLPQNQTFTERLSACAVSITANLASPLPRVLINVAPAPAEPTPGTSGEGSSDSARPSLLQRMGEAFKGCFCCGSSDKPPYETVV